MKKLLLLLVALLLGSSIQAQSETFKSLEEEILDHLWYGEYEEALLLAPKLLEEEPWRGEGHYYAAEAYQGLKDYQKAREYIALAEKQADPVLREKLVLLKQDIQNRETQDKMLLSAGELLKKGKKAEAAALFHKAWETYKMEGVPAQTAVDLYLELEKYDEALTILEDEVFEDDPTAEEYMERINNIPSVKSRKAYQEALVEGEWNMSFGYFEDALADFNRALSLKPEEPEALEFRNQVLDHLAWDEALKKNTVAAYKNYLGGRNNSIYTEEAEGKLSEAREALRSSRPNKAYLSYVYDTIAPIGVSFGSINNSALGFYLAGNANSQLLEGGTESSEESDQEVPAYGDVILGLTKKIAYPLWIYAGGGAAFEEFYESGETEVAAMADAGLILNISGFILRGGVKTDLEEYRFSAGLGFSF